MSAITTFFSELRNDVNGASFLEYAVVLGTILAVSIAVLTAVGGYAETVRDVMCGAVAAANSEAGDTAPATTC